MAEENTGAPAPAAAETVAELQAEQRIEEQAALDGSSEEGAEEIVEAPKAEAVKKIEKQLKKLKLKVDGEEFEEEFDPNDDEYLTRQFQLAKMSGKRANDYKTLEKELIQFMQELKNDPKKALTKDFIGLDLKKLAAEIIEEEIAQSQKSPEQIEKEKLEEELRTLKAEQKQREEENRNKELIKRQEAEAERYDMLMEKALIESDLPKTPYTVKKMAEFMLVALQNGVELTPADIVPLVREEMQEDIKNMFSVMPEDLIEQFIGKDVFQRVRKKNIEKAKNAPKAALKSIKEVTKDTAPKAAVAKKTFKAFFGDGV